MKKTFTLVVFLAMLACAVAGEDDAAKKARLAAMPVPTMEQAEHYYHWNEARIRQVFGEPLKVTNGGKGGNDWKSLVYDETKATPTFFTFYPNGTLAGDLSMLKGVQILPLKH